MFGMFETQNQWWQELYEELQAASCHQDLFQRVHDATQQLGFAYCCYGVRLPVSVTQPSIVVLDTYPAAWMKHYTEQKYLEVDPTVQHGTDSSHAIIWSDQTFSRAPALWNDAREHGLRVGVAQSCWSGRGAYGLFSVARDARPISESEIAYLRPRLRWVADNVHQRMQALISPQFEVSPSLSKREREVLSWTADGKTSWEISRILHISESTVNFHLRNTMTKLNAQNKLQAAVKAAAMGMLFTGSALTLPELREKPNQRRNIASAVGHGISETAKTFHPNLGRAPYVASVSPRHPASGRL